MPVAGLRGTGDWGADERPKNFRESILWMSPNGDTPLLGLTSKVKGKSMVTDDEEFFWWNEPQDIIRLQVNGALASGDTLVTVDSPDPDGTNIKRNYGKATNLVPGDILMVEPTADAASDTQERIIVTAVHSDTQFSVSRGASGTSAGTIANDVFLLHVGSAFAQGTAGPRATSRNPIKFTNRTQIFKTGYEITGTATQTYTRTGDVVSNDKKRRSFDHAKSIEMAMFFGKKYETVGENGKPLGFMGGLREYIAPANRTILANAWGLATSAAAGNNLMDAISPIFDYSTPGGDSRIALCGNGCLNALNKAILSSSGAAGVKIEWGMNEKYWGMNFRELLFPQGRIMLKTHPLLSRHSLYTYGMYILDMSAIKYVAMKGRDTKALDDVQNKDEDVKRGLWMTECSLMVDYAGQSCGYIGGFNNTIA
jgi:hypothetical protein